MNFSIHEKPLHEKECLGELNDGLAKLGDSGMLMVLPYINYFKRALEQIIADRRIDVRLLHQPGEILFALPQQMRKEFAHFNLSSF